MSKKLAAKASLIQMPPATPPAEAPGASSEPKPRTAPGSMAHFLATQSAAVREADALRERLSQFEGAHPVRLLDPRTVRHSRWANRHEDSFSSPEFAALKAEIASCGGNVQPISVRRLKDAAKNSGSTSGSEGEEASYEVVFGHRRHRACLELGLPVRAMIVEVSDTELFEAMDRENRARKDLSAWEQGVTYRRALDAGLYPSLRKMAEALGVDVALISRGLMLARLPDAVVAAFASPLQLQYRWAQPLTEALQRDPEGVLERAKKLKGGCGLAPAEVLEALINGSRPPAAEGDEPLPRTIDGPGGRRAELKRDARGRVVVRFSAGALGKAEEEKLAGFLKDLLNRN